MVADYLHSVIIDVKNRNYTMTHRDDGSLEIKHVNGVIVEGREALGLASRKSTMFQVKNTNSGKITYTKTSDDLVSIDFASLSTVDLVSLIEQALSNLATRAAASVAGKSVNPLAKLNNKQQLDF